MERTTLHSERMQRLEYAQQQLWLHEEFQGLPSRYWGIACQLLGEVDLMAPSNWVNVSIREFSQRLGLPPARIRDAFTWLEESGYLSLRFSVDRCSVRLKLEDVFIEPLGLNGTFNGARKGS